MDNEPSSSGSFPTTLLKPIVREMRLEQLDILEGISPSNELLSRRNVSNRPRRPTSWGISPLKLLFWSSTTLMKLRFPIWGDIKPTSCWECRSNTVTFWCWRPQVTPLHWQKWTDSFHDLMIPRGSSVILALKSSKASRYVSFPSIAWVAKPKHMRRKTAWIQKDDNIPKLLQESPIGSEKLFQFKVNWMEHGTMKQWSGLYSCSPSKMKQKQGKKKRHWWPY